MELKKELNEIIDSVGGDLKKLAESYGAWIVLGLVVVYAWRKIK
jgi:hypothetical protein